jgi:hypothetical protein
MPDPHQNRRAYRVINRGACPSLDAEHVEVIEVTDWENKGSSEADRGLGVYAQLLSAADFSTELSTNHTATGDSVLKFDKVTKQRFAPSPAFVKAAIAADAVAYAMQRNMLAFRKLVYMVTGTKTASGAAVTYSKGQSMKNKAHLDIDATSASVPLSVGPKGLWNKKTDGKTPC